MHIVSYDGPAYFGVAEPFEYGYAEEFVAPLAYEPFGSVEYGWGAQPSGGYVAEEFMQPVIGAYPYGYAEEIVEPFGAVGFN